MNSFDTKFYSLDTNVIKVDSGTNKLLVFNAETYILLGIKSRKKIWIKNYIYNILTISSRKFCLPLRSPFAIFVNTKIGCGSA